jgi:predicted hydrocarbon binding protein
MRRKTVSKRGKGRPARSARKKPAFQRTIQSASRKELSIYGVGNPKTARVSLHSLLFAHVLSTITPSMRSLTTKSGISIGRILYQKSGKGERWPYPAEALAEFFERAGYPVTYKPLPLNFEMELLHSNSGDIGFPTHSFEAGIISGFISASGGNHIHIKEKECSFSDGDSCTFEYDRSLEEPPHVDGMKLVAHLSSFLEEEVISKNWVESSFDPVYASLLYDTILKGSFRNEIISIAHYIGVRMGSDAAPNIGSSRRKAADYIRRTASLLSFGNPSLKKPGKLDIEINFNPIQSRGHFVDMTGAFLFGMVRGMGLDAKVTKTATNRSYRLHIWEKM